MCLNVISLRISPCVSLRLLIQTRSSNSLVTDSAAGATAFACGIKSYNGPVYLEHFLFSFLNMLHAFAGTHFVYIL